MPFVTATACVICVALLLWAIVAGDRRMAAIAKIGASAAFVAFGWAVDVFAAGPAGTTVFVALVLGALGDVALIRKEKPAFLSGLVLFLLAHVAYIAAFRTFGTSPLSVIGTAFMMVGPAWWVLGWIGDAKGMRKAVIAYVVVISAMVAMAAGSLVVAAADGSTWRVGLFGAAVLFYASDLFVARERFVVSERRNRLVGLPLYYLAQLAFAWFTAQAGHAT